MRDRKKRIDVKHQHEKAVADRLISILGIKGQFLRHGDDRSEPDILYTVKEGILGVEIATAYLNDIDAKQEWTLATGEREFDSSGYELNRAGVQYNPDERICERIQYELNQKCLNTYDGCRMTWLCIEQRDPMADRTSTIECTKRLVVLPKHGFERIYLQYRSSDDGSRYELLELFPNKTRAS